MPTAKYFDKCPDFPSDVPVADVPVISYKCLQENDLAASAELFEAIRKHGFFVLDLNTSEQGRILLQDAEAMFDLTNETFDLGKEHLSQYSAKLQRGVNGYKMAGVQTTDDGYKDALETYELRQDDILGHESPPMPKPHTITKRGDQCQSFVRGSHKAATLILDRLDVLLDLPVGTLSALCQVDKPSGTCVRMLRSLTSAIKPSQMVTGGAHTDVGVITLVFNVLGGLQIRPAESENSNDEAAPWQYIRPRQGCAVVNVGDMLVEWTGGVLRSSLHRICNPPGDQATMVRQSLAYLIRASEDASMKRLKGSSVIPALRDGEKDETRSPDEWVSWRVKEIACGNYQPKTIGGIPIPHAPPQVAV